ncbi:MAG: hypothetical protein IKG59_01865 [Firmicutes bacterium]|nr:hypothetical protein [Bacillota bacterium]
MNLTEKEKASRYDSLQTAIKWTIEQYRKEKTELENDAGKGRIPLPAAFNAGKILSITKAIEDMEKWV